MQNELVTSVWLVCIELATQLVGFCTKDVNYLTHSCTLVRQRLIIRQARLPHVLMVLRVCGGLSASQPPTVVGSIEFANFVDFVNFIDFIASNSARKLSSARLVGYRDATQGARCLRKPQLVSFRFSESWVHFVAH